ncbi:SDR family NAD(P)-dependent oxidoreductase [Streptomyces sp. NPDC001663]|uniref:SDR family NAD(P)-dependent oxidoreductase n=1 Tax=Streptomyces sp. NPDC001663 TaxID=3364597 RepID=UPI0036BB66EF
MSVASLEGKVAFISGTGGGQGREAARQFAAAGARVVGCDLDQEAAQETVDAVRAAGGEMITVGPVDLSSPDGCRDWISTGLDAYGRLDVLYNNAAAESMFAIDDADAWDRWSAGLRGEVDLVFAAIREAWPALCVRGGSIINVSSVAALRGLPVEGVEPGSSVSHSAAKAAILGLTRQVAAEGAPHGIRANALLPGFIDTGATAPVFETTSRETIAASIPLGRIGAPKDIAAAAVFFASDAAEWITGETLVIDGGMTRIGRSILPSLPWGGAE